MGDEMYFEKPLDGWSVTTTTNGPVMGPPAFSNLTRIGGQVYSYEEWLQQALADVRDSKPFTPAPTHDLEALEAWLQEEQ